jgi:type IV pilus assembly protein PilC
MPIYSYKAINETGGRESGLLEAASRDAAGNILAVRGFIPLKISEKESMPLPQFMILIKEKLLSVRAQDLIVFTKQFKTMIKGGVPTLKLLHVLENQTENKKLKKIAGSMIQDITRGESLFSAFKKHPETFSNLYCSMVRAGEASGKLPEVMERLIYIIEHEDKLKSDIRAALTYPVIVILFLIAAFFILLTLVIPKFVNIFLKSGVEIPFPTKVCMLMYKLFVGHWYIAAGLIAAVLVSIFYYLRTERGRYALDALMMKLPLLGPMFIKAAMSRFAGIFAILQSSGVSALNSLKILAGTMSNRAIAREFDLISGRLEEGRGIAEPLKAARYFTPMVTNMVAIGEEADNLEEMLQEISDHYDAELEYNIKRLSEAIGPVLTIGLAIVVGFFAFAIFLPMWDMVKMVR